MSDDYDLTLHLTAKDPEIRIIEALCICIEQVSVPNRARLLDYLDDRYRGEHG